MASKDIDIMNYSYPEMLDIYNVSREFKASVIVEMDAKLRKVREKLPLEYYIFYLKAHRIIWMIHQLMLKNVIQDALNIIHIEHYVERIRLIDGFETMDTTELFNRLTPSTTATPPTTRQSEFIEEESKYPVLTSKMVDTHLLVGNYSYPVAPTNLNSIKRITQFKNLCFDSSFRHNYYQTSSCDFQYTIPSEIKHVVSMRLASIELPNTWYLFSNRNKSTHMTMSIFNPNTKITTDYAITIPEGSYDNDSVATYLNATYFYNSAGATDLSLFQFIVNPDTFKTSIVFFSGANTTNLVYSICFLDDTNHNIMSTFGWIMGFRLANYYNLTSTITSEGMFDAGGDRYIYVAVNDYQKNNNALNMICFDNNVMEEDIIGKIPITNGKLSIIITESNALVKTRKYNGPVNIRNLHIRLLDKFGEVLDLNNMDFSFTLEMEILYEKFNFQDMR